MIGHDLVVTGGFHRGFTSVSNATYALDVRSTSSRWRRLDDIPMKLTHSAWAIHEDRMYLCGGYLGGHPGPAVDDCFVYHHVAPQGTQWQRLPSLPEPRAGGGMTYDTTLAVLIFVGGATRENPHRSADAIDHDETWMMAPHVTPRYGGWHEQAAFPLLGNHLSFVSTQNGEGHERHFYMGGQMGEMEKNNNLDELYEYESLTDQWLVRANMPIGRGHASSSTLSYACGFFIAGGAINGGYVKKRTDDISFYDPDTDQWMILGSMYAEIRTPVCGIWDDFLYCATGYSQRTLRRKLSIAPTE